jgi:multiple sugar transport system permease protein
MSVRTLETDRATRTTTQNPWRKVFNAETLTAWLFILPCMVGFSVFYLYPTLRGLWISTTNWNLLREPTNVGLENYQTMLQDPAFWNALKTIALYVVYNIPIQTVLAWSCMNA